MKHLELFAALAAPFPASQIKSRPQGGRNLSYITARDVMNRLDDVLGPASWWDAYTPGQNSVMCHLTVELPDGSTVTKTDAGAYAGMADAGDDDKSGFSDAFKRAAVKFGIGRHLYGDGVPAFVREPEAAPKAPAPARSRNRGRPAPAPAAVREPVNGRAHNGNGTAPPVNGNGSGLSPNDLARIMGEETAPLPATRHSPPATTKPAPDAWTGRKLYDWATRQGCLGWFARYARDHGYPERCIDWSPAQAAEAKAAFDRVREGG
jgi:Rad52/22 family double-strand break repair protein